MIDRHELLRVHPALMWSPRTLRWAGMRRGLYGHAHSCCAVLWSSVVFRLVLDGELPPLPLRKDTTMKLLWVGVIFGAGYALGRPEGRAKLAELVQRPEVAQLKQHASGTASSAAKTGQQQLIKTAQKVREAASEKRAGRSAHVEVVSDPAGSRRGFRLPTLSRRGGRPDASAETAAGPVSSATGT
jgi:hypothetical protein